MNAQRRNDNFTPVHCYFAPQISSHDIESPAKKAASEPKKNDLGAEDDSKKKKKKRSQKKSELNNLISDKAPMSEGYMGGGRFSSESECPILDSIEKKCRGVDTMSGDSHQNLLDACGEHQLCYLCVSFQVSNGAKAFNYFFAIFTGRFTVAV